MNVFVNTFVMDYYSYSICIFIIRTA